MRLCVCVCVRVCVCVCVCEKEKATEHIIVILSQHEAAHLSILSELNSDP